MRRFPWIALKSLIPFCAGLLTGAVICTSILSLSFTADPIVDLTGQSTITITLTDRGFEPEKSYISRGTRVQFVTTQSAPFWPASDLHPFHTIYPTFDPRQPIAATSSWSFEFNADGHWNFHDHIGLKTGAVIVIPPGAVPDPHYDVIAECNQTTRSGKLACWKEHITLALEQGKLPAALTEVARLHDTQSGFRIACHTYVHDVGLVAYANYGSFIPRDANVATCGYGFYHGYMEGFLAENNGNIPAAVAYCKRNGTALNATYPLAERSCMHGIGHGMMEYLLSTRGDLVNDLPQLVDIGLDACALLPTETDKFRCASGTYAVLKDWVNIQNLQHRSVTLFSLDDPLVLCRRTTTSWGKQACAWEIAKEIYILNDRNAARAYPAIWRSSAGWEGGVYSESMITSAAYLVGELGVETADTTLIAYCRTVPTRAGQAACVAGTLQGLVFNASPGNEIPRPMRFCTHVLLSSAEKNTCIERLIATMVDNYGESSREQICALAASTTPALLACR